MSANYTEAEVSEPRICEPGGSGLFFPLFESEQLLDNNVRAAIYVGVLLYLFCGVSVVADRFMEAIDRITSRKKIVRMRGTGRLLTIETWNGTMANLTLLALGSSAPEILLSIVEVFINNFHAGALGPGTMIGSAAFNLCCIVGVSCVSIPSPEIRKVNHQAVFMVTVAFALFAYCWLCFIVQINTPDVVTISEGVITIGFYPILLVLAYLAHIGYFSSKPAAPTSRPAARPLPSEVGDPGCIRDDFGQPLINPNGVLTFDDDIEEVGVGLTEKVVNIRVLRKNGTQGQVSCKFFMEGRTAVPSKDYVQDEGDIVFPDGVSEATIAVGVLPKRLGEHSDQFQIIIHDAKGGASFNPNSDGKDDKCVLTVCIVNENDSLMHRSALMRVSQLVDGAVNVDAISLATSSWSSAITSTFSNVTKGENGAPASGLDIALSLIFLPWRLVFAILVPPTGYCGGWLSFGVCMCFIGFISSCICDFSELFGCVTGVEDYITAITLVAMGTSMPDLFVSSTAAVQEEYADGSICTVTGGDSARVFLGIGIPWTIAAIYWSAVGATDDWQSRYPDYLEANPQGAFIVPGGMLGFNVVIYLLTAAPVLLVINLRRAVLGAELGGPFGPKILTGIMFFLMWFFYLYMSIWKIRGGSDDMGEILGMIWSCITTLEHVGLLFAVLVFCCIGKSSKANGAEESALDLERNGEDGADTSSLTHLLGQPSKAHQQFSAAPNCSPLRHESLANELPAPPMAPQMALRPLAPAALGHRIESDEFHDCDGDDPLSARGMPPNGYMGVAQHTPVHQAAGMYRDRGAFGAPLEDSRPGQHNGLVPNIVVGMAVNRLKSSMSPRHEHHSQQQLQQMHQMHQQSLYPQGQHYPQEQQQWQQHQHHGAQGGGYGMHAHHSPPQSHAAQQNGMASRPMAQAVGVPVNGVHGMNGMGGMNGVNGVHGVNGVNGHGGGAAWQHGGVYGGGSADHFAQQGPGMQLAVAHHGMAAMHDASLYGADMAGGRQMMQRPRPMPLDPSPAAAPQGIVTSRARNS
eukprot:TRINITY_DN39591_c0_g1_i1.p1 TRINITY_DN39591_c0_g1~~TRINITY_DN39591_c0_g1_i1.p1  ORF type:complete len:1030 (-),score=160.78 TRINITY_DN39591_c0_g1_i1:249-3338(-)